MESMVRDGISKRVMSGEGEGCCCFPACPILKSEWNSLPQDGQRITMPPTWVGKRNFWPHLGQVFSL